MSEDHEKTVVLDPPLVREDRNNQDRLQSEQGHNRDQSPSQAHDAPSWLT